VGLLIAEEAVVRGSFFHYVEALRNLTGDQREMQILAPGHAEASLILRVFVILEAEGTNLPCGSEHSAHVDHQSHKPEKERMTLMFWQVVLPDEGLREVVILLHVIEQGRHAHMAFVREHHDNPVHGR
jgi:hypothetical protein